MKTKITLIVALILMQSAICKAETSAVDTQGTMLTGKVAENSSIDAKVQIDVSLPSFPSFGPVSFAGDMKAQIVKGDHSITVKAEKLPELFASLAGIPESFGPVTLGMKVASSEIKINWDDEKKVFVPAIDLNVTAYKSSLASVSESSEKMAEFTLKDVQFEFKDVQDKTAHLTFTSTLPKCSNETLNALLSGKEIAGEVSVGF